MNGPQRCAFCHDGAPEVACPRCRTWLHAACWDQARRCPTLGCESAAPSLGWWRRFVAWGWGWVFNLTWDGIPDPTPELLERASARLAAGDLEAVVSLTDDALACAPDDAFAYYLRASAHQRRGARRQAHSDACKVLELTEREQRVGSGYGAPEWRARAWLLMGQTADAIDDEPAADAAFEEVGHIVRAQGRRGDVLHVLHAEALAERWDVDGALTALEGAGDEPEVALFRATLLRQRGELEGAIVSLTEAIARAKDRKASSALLVARWGARVIRGDPLAADDLGLAGEPGQRDGGLRLAQALQALLDGDRARARQAFGEVAPGDGFDWTWAALLGGPPSSEPPVTSSPWARAVYTWLLGRLSDDDFLRCAQDAAGPRNRSVQLHEAHALLALAADAHRDQRSEREHLRAAAQQGDMGGSLDAWLHGRARQLGARIEHRPPRLTPSSGAQRSGPRSTPSAQ
ncbi:MAG: hypothetical protein M9894_08625 [Planctomycetes bacterium]|nr:hypothetical protein [Planctomycetota bacterium]